MDHVHTAWYVLLALLGFGFVIFIHELGHFLFAKWAGVRVDRFSIGFGPVLLKRTIGDTEYALSLLPLGGYVKMLGQEDTPTAIDERARVDPKSFLAKAKGWQMAILLAGVLFNLASSWLILVILAWYGMPVVPPVVGDIQAEIPALDGSPQTSPAVKLGLRQGDRILSVNGTRTRSFEDVMLGIISAGNQKVELSVLREGRTVSLPEDGSLVTPAYNAHTGLQGLGFEVARGWRLMDVVRADGDLRPGDPQLYERIVAIAGKPLAPGTTGQQIEDILSERFGTPVSVTLEYHGKTREVSLRYAGDRHPDLLSVGLPVQIILTTPGSAAERAGLKPGDVVETMDGVPLVGTASFIARVRAANATGASMTFVVHRGEARQTVSLTGDDTRGRRMIGAAVRDMLGLLPFIPALAEGGVPPLAAAGITAGEAVVEVRVRPGGGADLEVVRGATATSLVLKGVTLKQPPAKAAAAVLDQLQSCRIEHTGDGHGFPSQDHLQIKVGDGRLRTLDLTPLPEALRDILLTGLKPGDHVVAQGPTAAGPELALSVVRGGVARTVAIPARDVGVALELGRETEPYRLASWTEAFVLADDAAIQMVDTTLRFIPRFFKKGEDGGIDPNKALTGPIGIFNLLRKSVEVEGYAYFLKWIAIIGLNLFLINLLPIPITDGGQLMMMGVEAVIRRPLPDAARNAFMWVGLVMVGALMLYVIGLDVLRLFGAL